MNIDKSRVERQFDKSAHVYDALSHMQREIVDTLLDECLASAVDSSCLNPIVCDFGCGTGYALAQLAELIDAPQLIGIDIAPSMLEVANQRLHGLDSVKLMSGDIEAPPVGIESVDIALSSSAIQWCDVNLALNQISSTLKPGGHALISSFSEGTLKEWRELWGANNGQYFVALDDLEAAAKQAGLIVDKLWVDQQNQRFTSFKAALSSVRDLGAGDATYSRAKGLMGARKFKAIVQRVEQLIEQDGAIELVYNVVYLKARKPLNGKR